MNNIRLFTSQNVWMILVPIPIWIAVYSFILESTFGISFAQSIVESTVGNLLLFSESFIAAMIARFYSPSNDRVWFVVLFSMASAFFVSFAYWWLMEYVFQSFVAHPIADQSKFILGGFAFLINLISMIYSYQISHISDVQEIRSKRDDAEKLAKEAELLKLRHQLQPHFLFNSLNSINALITIQPQEARKMVQQLSEFLRGTIRADEHNLVSIESELKHLELYLKIEKVRFGHRLNTEISLDDDSKSKKIPSLLLQPLMENAIKFGLYGTTDDVLIDLEIESKNNILEIRISNPVDGDVKSQSGTGFGLSSIQRRLFLLYGRADLLTTEKTDVKFTATLKIPQQS